MIIAKLFPWFPLAGKASDVIAILLGLVILLAIAGLIANISGKRDDRK